MTAIKTITTANSDSSSSINSNTAHASEGGPTDRRAQGGSSSSSSSSTGSGRSLSAAKAKFLDSVGDGVNVLMRRCGYSRERATNTLLRELCRGEISLADNEVFHMMKTQSVGLEEAQKALTVSKAVLRLMKHNGSSAVQAIDDLTSRLNVVSLLKGHSPSNGSNSVLIAEEMKRQQQQQQRSLLPTRPAAGVLSSPSQQQQQQPQPQQSTKKNNSNTLVPGRKNSKTKQAKLGKNSRKRSASGSSIGAEESAKKSIKTLQGRARADSVTEEVNAKIAESNTSVAAERPAPRTKRSLESAASVVVGATQPVLKRARGAER